MSHRTRLVAAALAVTALVTSCSSTVDEPGQAPRQVEDATGPSPDDASPAEAPPGNVDRYVALGDSFTAAPLVPTTDVAGGCFRSDHNYPSLVAERLDVATFVDVSCSGADTTDLTGRQSTVQDATVPPQLRAVTPATDLVTVGIGGNDFDLFHTLVRTCVELRPRDPSGSPCAEDLASRGIDLVGETRKIANRVETSLRRIQQRAPQAQVLVVGYLRLVPTSGRCADLPLARGDYAFGVRVSRALDAALARAARRTGAGFVDLYAASKGHDVCSEDPWVNGRRTLQGKALSFHPLAKGMESAADRVVAALSR
jgi:lysophospholipase L1-like esterase